MLLIVMRVVCYCTKLLKQFFNTPGKNRMLVRQLDLTTYLKEPERIVQDDFSAIFFGRTICILSGSTAHTIRLRLVEYIVIQHHSVMQG